MLKSASSDPKLGSEALINTRPSDDMSTNDWGTLLLIGPIAGPGRETNKDPLDLLT